MKVYTALLTDCQTGELFNVGVFSSKEKAINAGKNFIEEDGYQFSGEEQTNFINYWYVYFDCIINPEDSSNLDIHYTLFIEEFELE